MDTIYRVAVAAAAAAATFYFYQILNNPREKWTPNKQQLRKEITMKSIMSYI